MILPRSWLVRAIALSFGALLVACRPEATPRDGAPLVDAAPDPASTYPVRLQDDRGATVTVRDEPRRIVALLPSHTDTLFALGLGARVVGVDDYSDDSLDETRLPRLGGVYDTRLEVVLSLKPDLVLLSESSSAARPLEQSGITVWAGSARTFADIFRVIGAIGEMVNRRAEASQLTQRVQVTVESLENHLRGLERVSVYYELDANLYTVGPSSFIGVLLAKAGGANIVPAGLGDFPKISPEAVISGNPSIILGVAREDVASRPGWSEIAAVQAGRVYTLPKEESRLIARPGPRIAEGLRSLAHHLHPEMPL